MRRFDRPGRLYLGSCTVTHLVAHRTFGRDGDAHADPLLGQQVEPLRVGWPRPTGQAGRRNPCGLRPIIGTCPNLDARVRVVEGRRTIDVVAMTMRIDERPDRQVGNLLECGAYLAGASHLLSGVDNDDAVIPHDHGIGRNLVTDRSIDILGNLDDIRLEHPVAFE